MELHLTNLLSDQLIKALCYTLIHSLWQGLILAATAALVIMATKKSVAALRYNLMIGLLVLFSAAATITFFVQLEKAGRANETPLTVLATSPVSQVAAVDSQLTEKPRSLLANCVNYFNTHSDTVVLIWFLIICARCIQLGAGLHHIFCISRTNVLSPGTVWEDRVNELAESLGIKRAVALLQSGFVNLPMVMGHFKPVILIPIGLLTALSTEEVESILIHELAHVRRRDYMINILQILTEIFFFFNPAVLWISALIKAERENCCDDIVVGRTSNRASYIKALVSCHEYQVAMPAYVMGLGGQNDHFLRRVKRMLSNNNQSLNKVERMVLTICLIGAVVLITAFSKAGSGHENKPSKLRNFLAASDVRDTITKHLAVIKSDVGVIKPDLTAIKRDPVVIKTDLAVIERNPVVIHVTPRTNGTYRVTYVDTDNVVYYYNNSQKAGKLAYLKSKKAYSNKSTNYHYYSSDSIPPVRAVPAIPAIPAVPAIPVTPVSPAIPAVPAVPAIPAIPAIPPIPPVPAANSKIAEELIREGIVKDKKNFTFSMNDDELFIDGVKQSDKLHSRIIKKFVKPGGSINITYTVHADEKTITIN